MALPGCIACECLAHVFKDKIRTAWCTFSATFLVVTQTQNMMNVISPKNRRHQSLDKFCKVGLNPQISTKPQSLFWSLLIKGGSQWLHSPFKAMGWFKTVAIRPSSVWVQQPLWNAGRQTYYNTREADEQSHRKLWLWTKTAEHTLECLCRTQQQMIQVGNTRVRSDSIAGEHQKSSLSFHPVFGCCLSHCSVLKYWFENEKQEVQKSYTSLLWHQILLSCFSLKCQLPWKSSDLSAKKFLLCLRQWKVRKVPTTHLLEYIPSAPLCQKNTSLKPFNSCTIKDVRFIGTI